MDFLRERYAYKHSWMRLAALALDGLGSVFALLWRLTQKPLDPQGIKKILAIRLDHLGDVVMTRPALLALRKRFPQAQIDLLIASSLSPLFETDPDIRILVSNFSWFSKKWNFRESWNELMRLRTLLRREKYDLGIDFRGDIRNIFLIFFSGISYRFGYGRTGGGFLLTSQGHYSSDKHQVELNLQLLEPLEINLKVGQSPFVYSAQRKKEFWERFSPEIFSSVCPRMIVHPGAGYPSKRWPARKFRELIQRILNQGLGQVILIGTEEDKKDLTIEDFSQDQCVDLRGKTEIRELPILFDACDIYIGNDSGPAHLAAAQGLEIFSLFSGTNDWKVWRPWTERFHLLSYPVPCSPCEARICPLQHHDCMEKLSADEVFEALMKRLSPSEIGLEKKP
jgi:lipopolysaccharide heptosyltransferase II